MSYAARGANGNHSTIEKSKGFSIVKDGSPFLNYKRGQFMKLILITLMLTSHVFAGPREEAQNYLDRGANVSGVVNRMDAFSKLFIGRPYGVGGPLGEGPEGRYDQDPLYRFDTFDCTTYVETIVSLAHSRSVDEFEAAMNNIRYENGDVDYLKRSHFTDLWWIPRNIQSGLLTDITHDLGERQVLVARAVINLPGWLKKIHPEEIRVPNASQEERNSLLAELRGMHVNYISEIAEVPYVSINWILKNPSFVNKIPHGTVVNFVRPNWDLTHEYGSHQNISHQAFLFRKGNVLFLRHASTSNPQTVFELPFLDYIKKFENHATLKGVHFMRVNE